MSNTNKKKVFALFYFLPQIQNKMKRKFSVYQTEARSAVGGSQSNFGSARALWGTKGEPKKWAPFMGIGHEGSSAADRGDAAPAVLAAREKQGMLSGTPSDFQTVASGLGTDEQTRQLALKMHYSPEKIAGMTFDQLKRDLMIRFGEGTRETEEDDATATPEEKARGLVSQGKIFPLGGQPTYYGGPSATIPQLPGAGMPASDLRGAPSLKEPPPPGTSVRPDPSQTGGPSGNIASPYGPTFSINFGPRTTFAEGGDQKQRHQRPISNSSPSLQENRARLDVLKANLARLQEKEKAKEENVFDTPPPTQRPKRAATMTPKNYKQ